MRRRSKKKQREDREYTRLRREFLLERPRCGRCPSPSEQVHHMRGRVGSDYLDISTWMPVCALCHDWITHHPDEAKDQHFSWPRNGVRVLP